MTCEEWCIRPPGTPGAAREPSIGPRLDTPSMGGSHPDWFVPDPAPPAGNWCIFAPVAGGPYYLVSSDILPGWMTCDTPWWPNRADNTEPREHQPYAVP